jgi:hypothetical protein
LFGIALIFLGLDFSKHKLALGILLTLLIVDFSFFVLKLFIKLSRTAFSRRKTIQELEEGDILSQIIIVKGAAGDVEVRDKPLLPNKALLSKNAIYTLAGGLTQEQISQLKELSKKKLLNYVYVKESIPFVPLVLLAFILSQFIGDALWLFLGL